MWEEGVRIYGTPGVPNNFPCFGLSLALTTIKKMTFVFVIYKYIMQIIHLSWWCPKIVSESHGPHMLLTKLAKQKQRRPHREYQCGNGQIPSES